MHFLRRFLSSDLRRNRPRPLPRHHIRFLYDAAISIERPRDRGLDHAVAREANLKPLLNLKNLLISEPLYSIPYSQINQSKETLEIAFRPMDFIRTYPSVFQEVHPGSINTQPDIKLTPEVLSLNTEEDLLYQSVNYKQEVASRLLKLLMISRVNKIPINLLERLKWELGLPQDYEKIIIPEFPDYFRVISGKDRGNKELELVCWSDDFAVSEMEKKGAKDEEIQFSLHYSTGFKMDKNYKKWLDDWQKLPYVSPYENAAHLPVKSDESDRWTVAILHEVLNLFVGKKAERDSLMCLGDYLGLRSRFKLAFLHHPGIFYSSTKIGTQTVVLRDTYKRGTLIKRHALMDLRFKYVHLMNMVIEEEKSASTQESCGVNAKKDGVEAYEDSESQDEDGVEMDDSSEDDQNDDSEEEDESENDIQRGKHRREVGKFGAKNSRRSVEQRSNGRINQKNEYESSTRFSMRTNDHSDRYGPRRSRQNLRDYAGGEGKNASKRGEFNRGFVSFEEKFKRGFTNFEEKNGRRSGERRSNGRSSRENLNERSTGFSRRNNVRGDADVPRPSPQKFDMSRNRSRSKTEKSHT